MIFILLIGVALLIGGALLRRRSARFDAYVLVLLVLIGSVPWWWWFQASIRANAHMAWWLAWLLVALIGLLFVTTLTVTALSAIAVRRDRLGGRMRTTCSVLVSLVGAVYVLLLFTVPGQ